MSTRLTLITVALAALVSAHAANAQTNLQTFYDFGKDRNYVTTTVEGFYGDKWGSTFFFIDHDYNQRDKNDKVYAPSGTYFEIARALNFWQNSKLAPLSLHVEYNGGVYKGYTINNAFLFGVEWFIHNKNFNNTLTIQLMYKAINYKGGYNLDNSKMRSDLPLQLTFVWGMKDLFGAKGLSFSGFADFWWEDHAVYKFKDSKFDSYRDWTTGDDSRFVFLTEPQIWYNIGQHFGVDNLNVGGEVEIACDFGNLKGFIARPCLGFKWVF